MWITDIFLVLVTKSLSIEWCKYIHIRTYVTFVYVQKSVRAHLSHATEDMICNVHTIM